MDRGIGRSAADGEIVGSDHHRARFDIRPTEQVIGGCEIAQRPIVGVSPFARDLADFAEAAGIDQRSYPRACVLENERKDMLEL